MSDDVHDRRGRRRRGVPRAVTLSVKNNTRTSLRAFDAADYTAELAIARPRTRGECREDPRPCPWVGCKHHLFLDVNPETGTIKFNYPLAQPWELEESCALDLADRGGLTLEEVGQLTNLTRERVRQIEVKGLLTIKREHAEALGAA